MYNVSMLSFDFYTIMQVQGYKRLTSNNFDREFNLTVKNTLFMDKDSFT